MGHHQLCLVGRHWSRGHLDFRGVVAVPSTLANGHQPFSRGYDYFLSDSGGSLPTYSYGTNLEWLLGLPFP